MKKLIGRAAAMLLCAGLVIPAVPANAAYTPEEITLSLRPMASEEASYAIQENTVYLTAEQAQAGVSVHMGIYIEAERSDVTILSAKVASGCETITFDSESCFNPSAPGYTEEAVTYTLSDGTTFSTNFKPFCFGMLTAQGSYRPNCFGVNTGFQPEANTMITMITNTATMPFFGPASDELSFVEFDMDIAAGTAPGVYDLSFVCEADGTSLGKTYISSLRDGGGYDDVIPQVENARIVISDQEVILPEKPVPQHFYTDDAEQIAFSQFFPEDACVIVSGENGYVTEKIDYSQMQVQPVDAFPEEELDDYISSVGNVVMIESDTTEPSSPNAYWQELQKLVENNELYLKIPGLFTFYLQLSYKGASLLHDDGSASYAAGYVGHRGDANYDGKTDAEDASKILMYAANKGVGNAASLTGVSTNASHLSEKMAYFLADVDGGSLSCGEDGSMLDANDASSILLYAAIEGAGMTPDWAEILK